MEHDRRRIPLHDRLSRYQRENKTRKGSRAVERREKERERVRGGPRSLAALSGSGCRFGARTREPISPEIVLYSRGRGRSQAKRTILLEDIIYAGKGRVATALVAKWGPTLSYILGVDCACTCTHSVPGTKRYALLQVIPICRWHPPRRQQHRGPFRLRSSFPKRPEERQRERERVGHER